jgi:hypothetical protein
MARGLVGGPPARWRTFRAAGRRRAGADPGRAGRAGIVVVGDGPRNPPGSARLHAGRGGRGRTRDPSSVAAGRAGPVVRRRDALPGPRISVQPDPSAGVGRVVLGGGVDRRTGLRGRTGNPGRGLSAGRDLVRRNAVARIRRGPAGLRLAGGAVGRRCGDAGLPAGEGAPGAGRAPGRHRRGAAADRPGGARRRGAQPRGDQHAGRRGAARPGRPGRPGRGGAAGRTADQRGGAGRPAGDAGAAVGRHRRTGPPSRTRAGADRRVGRVGGRQRAAGGADRRGHPGVRAGGGGPGRLPDRAGVADQRGAARPCRTGDGPRPLRAGRGLGVGCGRRRRCRPVAGPRTGADRDAGTRGRTGRHAARRHPAGGRIRDRGGPADSRGRPRPQGAR